MTSIKTLGNVAIIGSSQKAIVSFGKDLKNYKSTVVKVDSENKSSKIASWGENNTYPKDVYEISKKSGVTMSGQRALRKAHYGAGFSLIEETFSEPSENKPSKRILTPKSLRQYPDINQFFKENRMNKFFEEIIMDLEFLHIAFPEYILSNDFNSIVKVKRQQAANCRFEVMDKNGTIKNIWLSSKWHETVDLNSEYAKSIPLIDPYWSIATVKEYCKKNKIYNFIRPEHFAMFSEGYYPHADWHAVVENGWVAISNAVPEFKKYLFKNQMNIKYHIEVSADFFEKMYGDDWLINFDFDKKQELREKFLTDLNEKLTTNENTGNSIISTKYKDAFGNEISGLTITAIDDKFKDGSYLPEASAANSEILSAMGIDVSLIGSGIPGGKILNGSGSDKRVAWSILTAMMKSNRETSLAPFYFIKEYNQWPDELIGAFEDTQITTLDINPTGTQQTANV